MEQALILRPGAIALVTGASSGIGHAIALRLLDQDIKVIATARHRGRLEACYDGHGENVLVRPLDVTDGDAVAGLIDGLPEAWRAVDILVASAGSDIGGRRRFDEGAIDDWVSTIETNVNGVMRVCHAVIGEMLARQRGHIVVIGSISGLATIAGVIAYSASKHAVRALTKGLRQDYAYEPLRFTEILPGMVQTGFAEARYRGDAAKAKEYYESFPGLLDADDIAAAAMFALEQPAHVNISQVVVTPTGDK